MKKGIESTTTEPSVKSMRGQTVTKESLELKIKQLRQTIAALQQMVKEIDNGTEDKQ